MINVSTSEYFSNTIKQIKSFLVLTFTSTISLKYQTRVIVFNYLDNNSSSMNVYLVRDEIFVNKVKIDDFFSHELNSYKESKLFMLDTTYEIITDTCFNIYYELDEITLLINA